MGDSVVLPCKIGDSVWSIRSYRGQKHPTKGVVSEMFFNSAMQLVIVVSRVARGLWGEAVFATQEEAENAIANDSFKRRGLREDKQQVKESICWDCKKAVGRCTWSANGVPVKGWEVEETYRKSYGRDLEVSYTVINCPKFEEG